MTNSKLLYFKETTPQMEQIFNSYMDETVELWNEEFLAETMHECGGQIAVGIMAWKLNQKWLEMVRDN